VKTRRDRNATIGALAAAIVCLAVRPAVAQFQDEIDIRSPRATAHFSLKCRISDYNGRQIKVIGPVGEKIYPMSDVVAVRYARIKQQIDAEQLLAQGKNDEAESLLKRAVDAEPRRWARREILGLLTGCALRREDFATAGSRFRQIYESDPFTRHVNLAPLVWADQSIDGLNRSTAAAWLNESKAMERLLGASLLLYDAEHGHRARDTIHELNRLPDDRIRLLSKWQERRLQITNRKISDFDVSRWATEIDQLEPSLRAGPIFLLGQARLIRQEYDLAAAEFLKLPIVYSSDHPLIARASFEAGRALLRNGLRVEAARLFQETATRYSWSTAAADARAALKELLASVSQAPKTDIR
jgi:tetratricopeptide (TPR) repeat protein